MLQRRYVLRRVENSLVKVELRRITLGPRMNLIRSISLMLAAVLLWHAALTAATTGSISGTIKDPSGAVLPGVALTATNPATGIQNKTTTDGSGFYSFPSLAVGVSAT